MKTIEEYKSPRGARLITTVLKTPKYTISGISDCRMFRVDDLEAFGEDLSEVLGVPVPPVSEGSILVNTDFLHVACLVFISFIDTPGIVNSKSPELWATPPFYDLPHVNVVAVPIKKGSQTDVDGFYASLDTKYISQGLKETRVLT